MTEAAALNLDVLDQRIASAESDGGPVMIRPEVLRSLLTQARAAEGLRAEVAREEKAHEKSIQERDDAEEAISQAYYIVTGRSPEWSNLFGHDEANEEIGETIAVLKMAVRSAESQLALCREALEKIRRLPAKPFPDAGAHSWEAFGRAVHSAWCAIQRTATETLSSTAEGK